MTQPFRVLGATGVRLLAVGAILMLGATTAAPAENLDGLTVIGVAPDGTPTPVNDYRWLVEEDQTYHVQTVGGVAVATPFDPNWQQGSDQECADGTTCTSASDCSGIGDETCNDRVGGETLSVSFHDSYVPVVAKGCVGWDDVVALNPADSCAADVLPVGGFDTSKKYYVSVVPRSGYSIGGAECVSTDSDTCVATVYVHQYPIQTAQISILIFEDNNSINGAPDLPQEDPAVTGNSMAGFTIVVEDAGGRYGASAGVQSLDAFGNPLGTTYSDTMGTVSGFEPLITGPDGRLTIKNLAPGKYGIQAVPPAGGLGWQQTSTIEGTKIIDAWVKANEPPFFAEFGPPGFHVFIGFVKEFSDPALSGGATLTGKVVNNHLSRPPDYAFYNGSCFGHTTPWVGLNSVTGGLPGEALYAAPTVGECDFSIAGVPDGDYQLVVWDSAMDLIIAFKGISIRGGTCNTPNGSCNFVEVPVFQWFHRQEHRVFNDVDGDGIWDADEGPMNDQATLLRWRDGTVYQENVTDFTGAYTFDQVFPFFSWLVTEVDFARFEATGLTAVVDNGGAIPPSSPGFPGEPDFSFGRTIAPQDQTIPFDPSCVAPDCIDTETYSKELGPVLTAGFQGFIGQTNAFLWGKRHYEDIPGLCTDGLTACASDANCTSPDTCVPSGLQYNGGISGIVFYAITRAENDPAAAAAEPWEPGIPGVTVNLRSSDGLILLNSTTTDSWDDSIPTGCKYGDADVPFEWSPDGTIMLPTDCYDGLRVFNQVRPAVFDGGYAFDDVCTHVDGFDPVAEACPDEAWQGFIAPGNYVVEVIPPLGYEILKPEDKNVDFGDEYEPEALARAAMEPLPVVPECVGTETLIPPYLTLFPDQEIESPFVWDTGDYVELYMPLCDRKEVILTAGANGAADFWLFTEVPVAAHANGFILDDTQNEFDPNSPNFGEKFAPPFVPVTIRDWSGRIIGKTLSDQYGTYNFLAPSTITTNLPAPSGMSPNMLTTCMNDPGDDPNNTDPNWNQLYSTFCYNFQYMPGVTTYLDTPVVPVAAFTGPDQFPLDCEQPDGTPRIWKVNTTAGMGPYIPVDPLTLTVLTDQTITITSMSPGNGCLSDGCKVQNPNYCNPAAGECPLESLGEPKVITRDYGFGAPGTLTVGNLPLTAITWSDTTITATVAAGTDIAALGGIGGRQLTVTRSNGQSTVTGITVQVGLRGGANVAWVTPSGGPLAHDIQDAIDAAKSNDLILVGCDTANELVVMWKPVQLQGSGECTIINAVKAPTDKLEQWRGLVDGLVRGGNVDLLPGQEVGAGAPEPATLQTEEGAGILVLAKAGGGNGFGQNKNIGARIDGFTIRGADTGGGIIANGYADYLQISNNRLSNNSGFFGGGIRVGHPTLTSEQPDGSFDYTDGENDYVSIHHNQVVFNGGLGGVGGGISMCTGSDSYRITQNWVCGNFSLGEGGGIGHTGRSDGAWELEEIGHCSQTPEDVCTNNGDCTGGQNKCEFGWVLTEPPLIADNTVIFNETFFQGSTISGGGIFIGGAPALAPGGLTPGAGNVQVIGNLIQGNSAGAGDGGGLRLAGINGQDVAANPTNTPQRPDNTGRNDPPLWNTVDVFNNMIVNNVTALAGGGISLKDAVDVRIVHNTIANNDSLATAGEAFAPGSPNQSTPQDGAGIASRTHSTQLAAAGTVGTFSDPSEFADNIIWQNRQFFFFVDDTSGCRPGETGCTSTYGVCPDVTGGLACPGGNTVVYDDLAPATLACDPASSCILTGTDPYFVSWYVNGDRSSVFQPELTTGIQTPAAFDEGGNFIRPKFGPLSLYFDDTPDDGLPGTLFGDYHICGGIPLPASCTGPSPAMDNIGAVDLTGTYPVLLIDFDLECRPNPGGTGGVDIGADEVLQLACSALAVGAPLIARPAIDSGAPAIRSAPRARSGDKGRSQRGKTDQ